MVLRGCGGGGTGSWGPGTRGAPGPSGRRDGGLDPAAVCAGRVKTLTSGQAERGRGQPTGARLVVTQDRGV